MLISQAWLIRTKRYSLHRIIGKGSYLLVPVIVFSTVDLLKYRLSSLAALGPWDYFFVALVLNALIAFVVLYALAIFYRKKPGIHARYMLSTVFPMFTPVTDRIMGIYLADLVPYLHLPTLEGEPILPVSGFLLADVIIIGLCIWDWRSQKRWNVFPVVLVILLLYHYSVLNFYEYSLWQTFCSWFVNV